MVPNVRKGNGASGWGDAATVIPWVLYHEYDDKVMLETQYQSMKGWVKYLKSRAKENYIYPGGRYGDWLSFSSTASDYPGAFTDKEFVGTAYFARSTQLLAQAAQILGKEEDRKTYSELLSRIKQSFQKEL